MFHLLLESVVPEFDHYLAINTFQICDNLRRLILGTEWLVCLYFHLPNVSNLLSTEEMIEENCQPI
jgi:hypothetical protein